MEGIKARKVTITLIGLTILFFVSYIYFASTLTSLGYALEKSINQNTRLIEVENELTVELARLQNPERLQKTGETLGLVEVKGISRYIDARSAGLGRLVQ